jgi:alpha-D-xyloside xylohydrolase
VQRSRLRRSLRFLRGLTWLAYAGALSCNSSSGGDQPAPPSTKITFDAKAGDAIAKVTIDPTTGGLSIAAPWSTGPLVQSPDGGALFAVRPDPDDLASWHDPETAPESEFVPLRGFQRVGDAPGGGAKLRADIPGGGVAELVVSTDEAGYVAFDLTTPGAKIALVELRLAPDVDAGGYVGFGERFDHVDARGTLVPLSFRLGAHTSGTNEAHVPVPTFTSPLGYGVTIATGEAGAADVARSDPKLVRLVFEGGAMHAKLAMRKSPLDVVAALTRASGLPRLPPYWSYAPMQWRNEGVGTTDVLYDVTTTREKDIPGGCIWVDNPWQVSYDDSTFKPEKFPDPKAMIDQVRALGFEVMVWSTPYLEIASGGVAKNQAQTWFLEAQSKDYLVKNTAGKLFDSPTSVAGKTPVVMIDLINEAARGWWSERVRTVTSLGVMGFKLDFAEDLLPEFLGRRLEMVLGGKPLREVRAQFPLMYHRAYRDAVPAGGPGAFILGRASSLGGQVEVDAIWPGDLDKDFRPASDKEVGGLPAAVVAPITLAASGFPSFAADTGGFRGGFPTKESFLRWAEHNAHAIIFQTGGGGMSHNPWNYDEEAVTIFRTLARRSMDLVPYRRALSIAASNDGTPTVRALPLAYPAEAVAMKAHVDDEYLLGPDVLVAPIIVQGATSREVYVPGETWVRWSTGEVFKAGAVVTLEAKLGDPIVLVRASAVLPLLAGDVDTLGSATDAKVVTAAMRASTFRAYAPLLAGAKGSATFEDGTRVEVDATSAPIVRFSAKPADGTLTATLDLGAASAGPSSWTFEGAAVTTSTDEASVSTCTTACVFTDAAKKRVTLHLPKSGVANGG